jgi:methyl-accepting chemotaxis protein
MSEAFAHPTSGLPVVAVLSPVTKSGRTAGVLLGLLEVESFSKDFIAHLSTGETGYVYMTNGDGLVLAHPDAKNLMKLDLSKYDFGKQMITKRDGMVRYVWEGVDKIVGFHEVDGLGWLIAATANCDELFAPAMEVRNSNIIVGAVALLAGAILLWAVTLWVVRPIIRIITSLKEGSSSVAAAAEQISTSSQTLAEGATEQAASLEETSAALETLTSMTTRNAEDAANAENIAHTAKESMEAAARDMGELTGAMADISEASQQTDKIIKSIDEIAFQTNLLALNAAVEAARAGQAGAGFAVVADEVRSLAMRAADAAHDTSQRIEATMVKARQAEEVVSRTNDSFNEVSQNSSEILELVLKIAQASQEQADGLGQLNTAARQMDHTTQTNAVHSEESAAASEELFSQAAGMDKDLGMLAAIIGGGGQGQARAIGSGNGNGSGSGAQNLPDNLQKALPAPDAL